MSTDTDRDLQTPPIDRDLERPYIIETKDLTKQFGDEIAVNSMSLDVPEGAIFGLIGPSGCGKTTTIRLLTGIYAPTSGEVSVLGKAPAKFTSADREKIGYLLQQFVLYPDLSVWENMNFAASFYGVSFFRRKRLNRLLDFVELSDHKNKISRVLSGGMNRRLSLAATLVHNPKLLFLDEPTAGIDPILRVKFWDYFRDLQKEGRTLVVTTQYVGEAEYCDLVGVMAAGKLLLVDSPEGLRRRAFGGEIVRIVTAERIEYIHRVHIEKLPFVKGEVSLIRDDEIEVIVDDAEPAIPRLIEACRADGLTVKAIEKKNPRFDDVFVRLVEGQNGDE
jgi:ABC-2 type transport system ATP-binding protein